MRLGKRSTEAQWLACDEPGELLPFLRRKLGLKASECDGERAGDKRLQG